MTPARLAHLRALADAATQGPLTVEHLDADSVLDRFEVVGPKRQDDKGSAWTVFAETRLAADAAFIAESRTAVPESLDYIAALQAEIRGLCSLIAELPSEYIAERKRLVAVVAAERDALKAEVERLQVQLAGCGVAGGGGVSAPVVAHEGDYGWSPSYQTCLDCARERDALRARVMKLEARGCVDCACDPEVNWTCPRCHMASEYDALRARVAKLEAVADVMRQFEAFLNPHISAALAALAALDDKGTP